jgi:hypothetical protein
MMIIGVAFAFLIGFIVRAWIEYAFDPPAVKRFRKAFTDSQKTEAWLVEAQSAVARINTAMSNLPGRYYLGLGPDDGNTKYLALFDDVTNPRPAKAPPSGGSAVMPPMPAEVALTWRDKDTKFAARLPAGPDDFVQFHGKAITLADALSRTYDAGARNELALMVSSLERRVTAMTTPEMSIDGRLESRIGAYREVIEIIRNLMSTTT